MFLVRVILYMYLVMSVATEHIPQVLVMVLAVISLTGAGYRDIYALCVALPKSFAEDLYECTKTLLEESVSSLCLVSRELGPSRVKK